MTTTKTIQEVAAEMYKNMEQKERKDGSKYYCNIKKIDWQKEIIHKAHGDALPDDYIYEFINDALAVLSDCEEGNEEEAIYEMEPDCYTTNLTAWLHSSNNRVYYITEALEEFGDIKDGFQLLGIAQTKEKQEVAILVLEGIKEYIASI
jgi:hypothetical protein